MQALACLAAVAYMQVANCLHTNTHTHFLAHSQGVQSEKREGGSRSVRGVCTKTPDRQTPPVIPIILTLCWHTFVHPCNVYGTHSLNQTHVWSHVSRATTLYNEREENCPLWIGVLCAQHSATQTRRGENYKRRRWYTQRGTQHTNESWASSTCNKHADAGQGEHTTTRYKLC